MKLIFVRHGETHENVNNICQGQLNTQLTEKGIEQAKRIAQNLKHININIAYSSDLDRCVNTCKEIIKYHLNTKLIITKELREQNKGIAQGEKKEIRNKLLKEQNIKFHEWLPEGGETMGNVWNRMVSFYKKIKQEHADDNILIVSHGSPIACLLAYLDNKQIKDTFDYTPFKNTAISIVNISDDKVVFEKLNVF